MKLPIPSLEQTKANFIKHAKAFDSFDGGLIEDFFSSDAIKLQELLLEYDGDMQSSYLERNWSKSYLNTREPLAQVSNFCFKLPKQYELNDFIYTFAKLFIAFDEGKLEFKTAKGADIFPRQFQILKGGARVPKCPSDDYALSFKNSDYISILKGNQLYKASVLANALPSGIEYTFNANELGISLAHLSMLDSSKASELYIKYEPYNAFFEVIENSRMNICIINERFADESSESKYMLYDAPCYHYKTLNFIYNEYTKNIYINGEHSFLDGMTISYALEWVSKNLSKPDSFIKPKHIKQYFDASLNEAIASQRVGKFSDNQRFSCELASAKTNGFSKDFIMQAAIAYACKGAYGRYISQYEAVDMREYDYGRTECVRAISSELIKALDSFVKDDLLAANSEHKERIKACKQGCGIDRHLLGLATLVPCLESADVASRFFNSAMFKDVCQTITSTSSLGKNDWVDVFYFHPVHDDGFGISYANVGDEYYFTCSYFDAAKATVFKEKIMEFFSKFSAAC